MIARRVGGLVDAVLLRGSPLAAKSMPGRSAEVPMTAPVRVSIQPMA